MSSIDMPGAAVGRYDGTVGICDAATGQRVAAVPLGRGASRESTSRNGAREKGTRRKAPTPKAPAANAATGKAARP